MRKALRNSGILLAACFAVTEVAAQEAASLPASTDLLDVSCGEYLQTARIADPGQRPSRSRRREAEEAQDSLINAMLWLHGYRSGLAGANQAPQPLTEAWIVEHVGALARVCRERSPDGTMPLIDAARQL